MSDEAEIGEGQGPLAKDLGVHDEKLSGKEKEVLQVLSPDFNKDGHGLILEKMRALALLSCGISLDVAKMIGKDHDSTSEHRGFIAVSEDNQQVVFKILERLIPDFEDWKSANWHDLDQAKVVSLQEHIKWAFTSEEARNSPKNISEKNLKQLKSRLAKEYSAKDMEIEDAYDLVKEAGGIVTPELAAVLKNGDYDLLIGDDTSGRLSALILHDLTQRYARENPSANDPPLLFVAGGRGIEERKAAIQDHFQKLFKKAKQSPSRALLVTETIATGNSERVFAGMMREIGVPTDIATVELIQPDLSPKRLEENSDNEGLEKELSQFANHIKQIVEPSRLFINWVGPEWGNVHGKPQGTVKKLKNTTAALSDSDSIEHSTRKIERIDPVTQEKVSDPWMIANPKTHKAVLLQRAFIPHVVEELYKEYFETV